MKSVLLTHTAAAGTDADGDAFGDLLRERGINVVELPATILRDPASRTSDESVAHPDPAALRAVDERLIEGGIDCIAFSSPLAVRSFAALLPEFRQATVLVAVLDRTSAAAAATVGLRVDIIAPEADAVSLADAVAERLESDDRIDLEWDSGWDLA